MSEPASQFDFALGPWPAGYYAPTALGGLALFRGRRMLFTDDGALRTETVPAPRALEQLVLVPTPKGVSVGRPSSSKRNFGRAMWIAIAEFLHERQPVRATRAAALCNMPRARSSR